MKIGPPLDAMPPSAPGVRPGAAPAHPAAPGAGAAHAAPHANPGGGSGVSVTRSASALALQQTDAGADFDTAKVQQMRDAIASGSFRVNAEAIADKLLANAQEMLERAARR